MALTLHVVVFLLLKMTVSASLDYRVKGSTAKVVGGDNAEKEQFPFIGSLIDIDGYHRCGASLIDKNMAVTAAHCFDSDHMVDNPPILVAFGGVQLSVNPFLQHWSTFEATLHPYYDNATLENDIALIRLDSPVKKYNGRIQRIILSSSTTESSLYSECFLIGWGDTKENGSSPDILQYAEMSIYEDVAHIEECKQMNFTFLPSTMLCAGNEAADACAGDSGGPLACRRQGAKEYELAGIVSYGHDVCETGHPGVYTRVSTFRKWLEIGKDYYNAAPSLQMSNGLLMCMASLAIRFQRK